MGRVAFLLALLLAAPGAAAAKSIQGTAKPDRIHGTARPDFIAVVDGGRDTVTCGKGRDVVNADAADRIAKDCEVVSRRIALDSLLGAPGQHRTHVESSAAANGSTVVSVFQTGRFQDGGAAAIGWATSTNGGLNWRAGLLPGVTSFSPLPGPSPRASDPVVAYDAEHATWLAASLIVSPDFSGLWLNRSADGITWSQPVVASQISVEGLAYDKEWLSCDNGPSSPFRGSCYLVFTDFPANQLSLQASHDGGATWSPAVAVDASAGVEVVGALPLAQPNGSLTVVYDAATGVYASHSTDGGATFPTRVGIAPVNAHPIRGVRAPSLPAATVDASGRIFVVWGDCSLRASCAGNDIVLTSSADGVTWTPLSRVRGTGFENFVPGIAADPQVPGRLAVVSYVRVSDNCAPNACTFGVAVTRSSDGGRTWSAPQRLDAQPMQYGWLAEAGGAFLGDYVGIAFTPAGVVPTFPLATRPVGNRLSESMFATVLR
jgi:hypothetical protein